MQRSSRNAYPWVCLWDITVSVCEGEGMCPITIMGTTSKTEWGPLEKLLPKRQQRSVWQSVGWRVGVVLRQSSGKFSTYLWARDTGQPIQPGKYVLCRLTEFVCPNELQNTSLSYTVNGSAAVSAPPSSGFFVAPRERITLFVKCSGQSTADFSAPYDLLLFATN